MRWPSRRLGVFVVLALTASGVARAGSYAVTLQSQALTTMDAQVKEDTPSATDGDKTELRLKGNPTNKHRNVLVDMPMPAIGGATILQAWLKLTEYGANSTTPIDARVYPVTESWNELQVSWKERVKGTAWTTPGGTHGPDWAGRTLVSSADNGTQVSWQVGPILSAWQRGELPKLGLVIAGDSNPTDREVVFRSSEYTTDPTDTPQLVVYVTDEPPALRSGSAEIQPNAVRVGATDTPLTLWLDVDAVGATPSGSATGFDLITLSHGAALSVSGLDTLVVGGTPVPLAQVSWYDNGTTLTVRLPRVRAQTRVRLGFRVNVLSPATTNDLQLPAYVDDSTTPGAWSQVLWPRDADGIAGNGDSWLLTVSSQPPVLIDLVPDTATVVSRMSAQFDLFGQDAQGNRFAIDADSLRVSPAAGGTITPGGLFTAGQSGTGLVIAYLAGRRDTSRVTVTPALLPAVTQVTLRDRAGVASTAMTPLDTMFLDLNVGDGDGFRDITGLDFDFAYQDHAADRDAPAFHGAFRWRRGGSGGWSLVDPPGASWALVPGLCSVDTTTNATTPQTARLAFVTGRIARASGTGGWNVAVQVASLTPPDTGVTTTGGFDVAPRLELAIADTAGAFSPGRAGAAKLGLREPTSGKLSLQVLSNAQYRLDARALDMAGLTTGTDTLHVGGGTGAISWAYMSSGGAGGTLDTAYTTLATGQPPLIAEVSVAADLYLWLDHPAGLPAQDYRGGVSVRSSPEGVTGQSPAPAAVPLTATVVGSGEAAESAIGEVLPNSVQVGVVAQPFIAYLLPNFQAGDTGIDRALVSVPPGYGTPTVTSVRVAGSSASFTDASAPGLVQAVLSTPVTSVALIEVRFSADTPVDVDSTGANLAMQFDDSGTSLPPQAATEGDADGIADGNDWRVVVTPGPVARVVISPDSALCYVDSTVTFSARADDAWGHRISTAVFSWSTTGGVGNIGSLGDFHGTAMGTGFVIAQTSGIADTARVTVRPVRGLAVREIDGPSTVSQGDDSVAFQFRVVNLGSLAVSLDTVALVFTRSAAGDANTDFAVVPDPSNPATIEAGDSTWVRFSARVATSATTGPLVVDARAVGTESGSGAGVSDADADARLSLMVSPGGITVAASQLPMTVRAGAQSTALLTVTLTNGYSVARTLRSLVLTNRTSGPGDPDQLDAELGDLTLYKDDGDGLLDPSRDLPLLQTVAVSGAVHFTPLDLDLPSGGSVRLLLGASTPLSVRDGDVLDLSLADEASVAFAPEAFARNAWPLDPPGTFPLDGMTAAQIGLERVTTGSLLAGSVDGLALAVVLPPNGYAPDTLERLGVIQLGTASPGTDIARLRAWADDGDGAFQTASDRPLGTMSFTGGRWELTGLAVAVPAQGLRVFFSVDLAEFATEGRTVRLALPAAPDVGVGMTSDDSGPLDRAVENPIALPITTADRITVAAIPAAAVTVRPGQRGVMLHHLAATNSYAVARTFTDVTFTDRAAGPGPQAALDREVERLMLRADGNGDGALGDETSDPVLGTAFFSNGRAAFTGLQWNLAPGTTSHLFLVGDVSRTEAADGDVLSATLAAAADLGFAEPAALTSAWPVDSRARATVDGMTSAQVTNVGAPAGALAPGDGPVLALDVVLPRNGYADDVLNGIRVVNLGSAVTTDVAELRLWGDGGDGVFSAGGGDDRDLGPFAALGGTWQSPVLSEPLAGAGARLFVALRTAAAAADSATVRLAIPVGGVTVQSGNDGPLDRAVENEQALLISTSPLLATLQISPAASTVGQSATVRMVVRNAGSETVTGIAPSALTSSGTAGLTPVNGPLPVAFDLSAAEVDTFTWVFVAAGAGEARFAGDCAGTGTVTGLTRRALPVTSNQHRVYAAVSTLDLLPARSMPATISRGQADVVPFSFTFTNPGGASASAVRLRGLRVRLEDENGIGLVPAQLLTRVELHEGTNLYLVKTALETSGDEVDLALSTVASVTGLEPTTLSLRLDVSAAATAPSFRVVITDSTWFTAEDGTSGAPVTVVLGGGAYPIRSGLARLVESATRLDVTGLPAGPVRVGRGAPDAPLLGLRLENPGVTGISSDVRVAAFGITLCDTLGTPLTRAADWLERIRVRSPLQTLAVQAVLPGDSASLRLLLSLPVNLPANVPVDLAITGDVAAGATLGAFRLRLAAASEFDARDANTHAPVAVFYASDPTVGATVSVEAPAETLRARGTPALPVTVGIGQTNVTAMILLLRHPGGPGSARIRLDSLTLACRDESRAPRVPGTFIGRLRLLRDGIEVANLTGLPGTGSTVAAALGGWLLEPADSSLVRVMVDIAATAPVGSLELTVSGAGVHAVDANSGLALRVEPLAGAELPMYSGLTRLASPARDLSAGLASRIPAALAADGREATVGMLALVNLAPPGSGAIALDHLTVHADAGDGAPRAVGAVAGRVIAYAGGTLWAQSAALTPDSVTATLIPAGPLDVLPGVPVDVELRLVTRIDPTVTRFRLGLDAAGVGVVQPASALLAISVRPAPGQSFPLWTEAAGFTGAALAESYANFPNPFAAGRQSTAFVYYLSTDARVTLRIWTPRGEAVATLIDDQPRSAGLHQDDAWDGRNGAGDVLRNGVYVAELKVTYDGGSRERVLRKVAVVR